jgi:ubiquitin C-terminal hydrolase
LVASPVSTVAGPVGNGSVVRDLSGSDNKSVSQPPVTLSASEAAVAQAVAGKRTRDRENLLELSRRSGDSASSQAGMSAIRAHNLSAVGAAANARNLKKGAINPATQTNVGDGAGQQGKDGVLGVCGLKNIGNTCYMNASVQCVSQLMGAFFVTRSLNKDLESMLNTNAPLGFKGEVPIEFSELVLMLWGGMHKVVTPRRFKAFLASWNPAFRGWRQHGK